MRAKEISPLQFIVTITASERLIIEAYSDVFGTTIQDAVLVMCVRGFHSYAEMIIQYNKNTMLAFDKERATKHIQNLEILLNSSDEAQTFRRGINSYKKQINLIPEPKCT